ncbi:MAG TPA: ParB/RepB/Spo0J family partition protein [Chloroflexia bacterium]|nr:ParB/RepB/Spo0J family partition protein [Chloroflexia bacterium]
MPRPKGGLGRGLGALIPQSPTEQESATQEAPPIQEAAPDISTLETTPATPGLLDIPIHAISPNPRQPRQAIQADALEGLAASIREHGVLQPLVVMQAEEQGGYNLIAGERRWRAAILAGCESVPAIIKEATSREMLEIALVENLQRADLNPLEEAAAYRSLVEEFGMRQEEVAERVGKARSAVANSLRLLRLPAPVQESLALGLISEGHARAMLQVPSEHEQLRLLEHVVADGLNVRQTEALARRLADRPAQQQEEEAAPQQDVPLYNELHDLEDRFRSALGTKVQLSRSRRGGKLVIYFYSDEELDRIYGTIVGEEE